MPFEPAIILFLFADLSLKSSLPVSGLLFGISDEEPLLVYVLVRHALSIVHDQDLAPILPVSALYVLKHYIRPCRVSVIRVLYQLKDGGMRLGNELLTYYALQSSTYLELHLCQLLFVYSRLLIDITRGAEFR